MKKIGISYEEYKARGLNVHAWRHFCNTEMQKGGMTIQQVQAVTGHKTVGMTERYTHFNPLEFGEATEIQAALLAKKPEEKKTERPALSLVKMPVDENTETNKQAS